MSNSEESVLPDQSNLFQADVSILESTKPPRDPADPPWGLVGALLTWIASVVLLLLPQIFALPYIFSHYRGARPSSEQLLADKTLILILVSGILPVHLITLGLAWCVATHMGKVPVKDALKLSWGDKLGTFKSVAVAISMFAVAWFLALFLGGKETDLERVITSSRAAALIIAFIAVATAPLVEEIIYRGLLFAAWERLTGSIPAVIIVTLMFAIPHVPQYWPNVAAISSIAILSIVLTAVRAYTGRLLPCFIIHLVFNGIQSLIIVLEPYVRSLFAAWRHEPVSGFLHSLFSLF